MGFLSRLIGRERRSTSAHPRDPVLAEWFGSGAATASGESVTPENARSCPEVDACIGLNEDTIATVPLDLFERTGDREGERQRAAGHPLHDLVHDRPNGWQTSVEFRQMMEGWRETHGNAYARIIAGGRGGYAQALEPVHPREMNPFRAPNGGVAYRWSPPDSQQRILLQHEVLHLRHSPSEQWNIFKGESPVRRHAETIGLAMATGRYLSLFFGNNATPKIEVKVPGSLSPEQVRKTRDLFVEAHGRDNMHKPVISHSGMEVKAIGATNDDAQVVQIHEQAVARIARIWDVPLHLIGETSKATSWGSGIEQQSIGFVVYYMRSKFVAWEQALNVALMSSEARRRFNFEFNIDALLRGDFKTRMEGYALMIQWGLASPNEIRRLMNLPPVEGGDERIMPLNMVPATRIMDVLLKTTSSPQQRVIALDDATRMIAELIPQLKPQRSRAKETT